MATPTQSTTSDPYMALQETEEFQDLRRRFRRFVFPVTAFFLTWYFAYVLAAVLFPEFMSIRVWGNVNIGLLTEGSDAVGVGDWVLIHVGFAMSKIDEEEARATREFLISLGEPFEAKLDELEKSTIE